MDVNTGRFVGKKRLRRHYIKTNVEAVKEIAHQLRIRNCGGIIILDLIDMEKEINRATFWSSWLMNFPKIRHERQLYRCPI